MADTQLLSKYTVFPEKEDNETLLELEMDEAQLL